MKDIIFGHKVCKQVFTADEILNIASEVDLLVNEVDRKNFIWKFYESSGKINRIEYFVNFSSFFKQLSLDKKIINLIKREIGYDVVLFKDKINFKYPGGEGFEPHQDITAGWGRYSNFQISVAIPLTSTNIENGAIEFGSPITKMINNYHEDIDVELDYTIAQTKIGDILLFDSYVPHKSGSNNSKLPRPILFYTYTLSEHGDFYEKYHYDKFQNVPPDIHKEKGKKYRSGNTNELRTYN